MTDPPAAPTEMSASLEAFRIQAKTPLAPAPAVSIFASFRLMDTPPAPLFWPKTPLAPAPAVSIRAPFLRPMEIAASLAAFRIQAKTPRAPAPVVLTEPPSSSTSILPAPR